MATENVLILVPARGGSTRVINKNLRILAGKPLLVHTIEAGLNSGIGRVVVSTDDALIAAQARQSGAQVPFTRPPELSTAWASSVAVIQHALHWLREHEGRVPEIVAFCPPTNPFRSGQTIREMFERLSRYPEINSIVTITRPATHPFRIVRQGPDGRCQNGVVSIDGKTINDIERSQDWPEVWEGSPACRMTRSEFFFEAGKAAAKTYDANNFLGYPVPEFEATDIDDEKDFIRAEFMAAHAIRQE